MSIDFADGVFHLRTDHASYAFALLEPGVLAHLHWGRKLRSPRLAQLRTTRERAFSPTLGPHAPDASLDTLPQEFPSYGSGDFRAPAVEVQAADGSTVSSLRYRRHRVARGKQPLPELPAVYVENEAEADTLEIELHDALTGLCATLSYSVFPAFDVITRAVRLRHEGAEALTVRCLLSASVDFPTADFCFLQLSGAWARERHVVRAPLRPGTQSVESRRGASSHQHNPFFALLAAGADEEQGEVFGFSLVYSGNFLAGVEVDQFGTARAQIGLNPFDFAWRLEPGGEFQSPEAVLVFSAEGLGGLSRCLHRCYRQRLCRGAWRDRPRPVLLNNWEATYFDFDADKIEAIARAGRDLGVELCVLDDGWFGRRDDDRSSLGDWTVDRRKLPGGLEDLAGRITRLG
ncbi:MAG: alpha-galactosidase, partial [Gluconacetobacter diazotrophicus]|nr:alpha-galactosidase [Gluconacetobacter diazotrophicus]